MSLPSDNLSLQPVRTTASLDYARPMPAVRQRPVLPRSLAMTLMIIGGVMSAGPCLAIAWGAFAHIDSRTEDFAVVLVGLTGCVGLVLLFLSIYLSPRVPRMSDA